LSVLVPAKAVHGQQAVIDFQAQYRKAGGKDAAAGITAILKREQLRDLIRYLVK